MDAISDVALAGAGGFVAGGLLGGVVNAGKYGYSDTLQAAGSRGGSDVTFAVGQSIGTAGKIGTGANSGGIEQQTRTENAGTVSVNTGPQSIGIRTQQGSGVQTRLGGNPNTPAAIAVGGTAQTAASGVQTPTAVQQQMQTQQDTQIGKTIKSEGKVTELLEEAMAQPVDSPARRLAETLLAQLEPALMPKTAKMP